MLSNKDKKTMQTTLLLLTIKGTDTKLKFSQQSLLKVDKRMKQMFLDVSQQAACKRGEAGEVNPVNSLWESSFWAIVQGGMVMQSILTSLPERQSLAIRISRG